MQTWGQKGALKHVHLPTSMAASYSDICIDGNTYHLHPSPSQSTHTYGSEAHGSLSTIDHFLGPSHMLSSISKCVVTEEDPPWTIFQSWQFGALLPPIRSIQPCRATEPDTFRPNWDVVSPMEIEALYTIPIEEQLSQIKCPTLEECLETPTLIDQHLTTLTTLMLQTAYNSIPPRKYSPHKKQGWNDKLRQTQRAAQQAYKAWKAAGKPRNPDHPMRNHYKSSKGRFRSLLRQHKREERENFFASLDLHNTDPRKLFRTIRQKNGHRMVPTTQLVSRGKTYESHEVMDGWKLTSKI